MAHELSIIRPKDESELLDPHHHDGEPEMSEELERLLDGIGADEHGEANDKDSSASPWSNDAEGEASMMTYVGHLREMPRVVRYRERVIPGLVGSIVIGAADVAVPGEGVKTVHASAYLSRADYDPRLAIDDMELEESEHIGGFFEEINSPFRTVSHAARGGRNFDFPVEGCVGFVVSGPGDVTIRAAWRTPLRNLSAEWAARWRRAPNAAETANLKRLAARAAKVVQIAESHGPNRTDEMDWNTAQNLISFYITNGRGPDYSDPVSPTRGPETDALIRASVSAVPGGSHGFFENIAKIAVAPITTAVKVSTNPLAAVKTAANAVTHPLQAAQSLAHSTLVQNVLSTAKDVARSKITGAALAGLSVAIPAVGVPALAAYAAANKALDAIDAAKKAINEGQAVAKQLTSGKPPTPAQLDVLKKAQAAKVVHDAAVQGIEKMQQAAAKGDPKEATRSAILSVAKKAREQGAAMRGHLVTEAGNIIKGNFFPA
jgi:hypothetical protein